MSSPLSIRSFPRAIVHLDGDSFFASVEQLMNHELRGKPVVTGGERGAITSLSYEAKRMGAHRGMSLRDVKKVCPDVIIVSSDYTSYSIYARRMYAIVRSFTPDVEEYSIDECFADITGLRQKYRMPYEEITKMIQAKLKTDLGLSFSAGLGPNKSLAKIASKFRKPAGFTSIPAKEAHLYLKDVRIGSVWGMGGSTSLYMDKLGVHTALEFAEKDAHWLEMNHMSKPLRDIWTELRGGFVKQLNTGADDSIGSIMKTQTFTPPSSDRAFILSQLARNVEGACMKARRHGVRGRTCSFYLKTQDFTYDGLSLELSLPLADPREFMRLIEAEFDRVYKPGILYRATGFTLRSITAEHAVMNDLFGESERAETKSRILETVDGLNHKFGNGTVHFAASFTARRESDAHQEMRARKARPKIALSIERKRKSLNIPYLGIVR
ncbi:MAG TPA: DNA polymerase IV [Candidatus Paceibacterota bacterium]|jgi:DNA polymerase-4/DNA polymerase V|nr:DNA polymerase IV [Candidatus Paceibacterota bacterium]